MSDLAMQPVIDKLLTKEGKTVLIIGVYTGKEAEKFLEAGKEVIGIDLLPPYRKDYKHIQGRFEDHDFGDEKFDFVVSSHTLEHMGGIDLPLQKMRHLLSPDGWMGIVVPGYSQDVFHVGHYTLWSPVLLIYNLVENGWDCKKAEYYTTTDKKHVGLVVQNRGHGLHRWGWDSIEAEQEYFPVEFKHGMNTWLSNMWTQEKSSILQESQSQ